MTVIVHNSYGTRLKIATTATVYYPDEPPDSEPPASGTEVLPVYLYAAASMSMGEPFYSFVDRAQLFLTLTNTDSGDIVYQWNSGIQRKPISSLNLAVVYYFPPQGPGPGGEPGPLAWENLPAGAYNLHGQYSIWNHVDGETAPLFPTESLHADEAFSVSRSGISPPPFWPNYHVDEQDKDKAVRFTRSRK